MKNGFVYTNEHKNQISFPLGGIGSGCIGLTGNGRLRDWEIFNRPNKGSYNGFSHFAIKAEDENEVLDTRVLHGDLPAHYVGEYSNKRFLGYGFGPDRQTMAGFPSFKNVTFKGEFPVAEVQFEDDAFPGTVTMEAFNPFIPMNDKDSSIPAAFFELEVANTTDKELTYSIALSLQNPSVVGAPYNTYSKEDRYHIMDLGTQGIKEDSTDFGGLSMATDAADACYQEYWYRGSWFDEVGIYWRDFSAKGPLENRRYEKSIEDIDLGGSANVKIDSASLCARVQVKPGETKKVKFVLGWYYPNYKKYWGPEEEKERPEGPYQWRNYYAKLFKDAKNVVQYGLNNWEQLYKDTNKFRELLYSSSLPEEATDAVASNISILKSPTCLRLDNGEFYGWEGVMTETGSCEGSCTHVWNYAYALPFLFPNLERSMRELDYTYNLRDDGSMPFRLQLPIGRNPKTIRACADGQLGGIIKMYREWKISGDDEWLKTYWPKVKKSLEYAWSPENMDRWDPKATGVLWGRQHHTLDMELFGPNSWLTGFYLAALKAGAEMAEYLGDKSSAKEYMDLFNKGKEWSEEHLFNGNYFIQKIDLKDKSILEEFEGHDHGAVCSEAESIYSSYWCDEHEEIKFQIGEGSSIDQVLAQWHANLMGLGEIFDTEKTRKALKSMFTYNYKENMRDHYNPCRLYCLYDEGGITICEWPDDVHKPYSPVPYSEETMNGFEYQAACHMIQEGMIEEGMTIVKAIRDRYDGHKRNPWNEFECGSNYARSMASYALLIAFSGFTYHMSYKRMGFNPINKGSDYRTFWSVGNAWGEFRIDDHVQLDVAYGQLSLKELELPFLEEMSTVTYNGQELTYTCEKARITFDKDVTLEAGDSLVIK